MEDPMRKSVFVVAALVAAVSTAAVAKDVKQEKRAGPVQMTDSEMDKVTAGFSTDNNGLNGGGVGFGGGNGGGNGQGPAHNNFHGRFQ
jgi:opacity protein-like surface antigen